MIERLLAADAALERDDAALAQKLYGQVADADPRNAIALVGLARVAARRGEPDAARAFAERALAIDPEEAAARRLLIDLDTPVVAGREPAQAEAAPVPAPAEVAPVTADPAPTARPKRRGLRAWLARILGRG